MRIEAISGFAKIAKISGFSHQRLSNAGDRAIIPKSAIRPRPEIGAAPHQRPKKGHSMHQKAPKKTLYGCTAQTLLKSASIVDGRLLVKDRWGTPYVAQRSASGAAITLTGVASGWTATLAMDAWCAAELAWWEARLDALTPGREMWLLVDPEGVVVGHLAHPHFASDPERTHPWRVDNAARRPVPALGERYAPEPVVRPRRTRGMAPAR